MDDYLSEAEIVLSARKHGIADEDIRHALKHSLISHSTEDTTIVRYVGPSRTAQFLEIAVVYDIDGLVVIHAMPARSKYLP